MTTNEIVKSTGIISTLDDAQKAANAMALSGFFPDTKTANQAIVKILAGQELGFGPFASMTGVAIIQGKPAIGANLQAAAIKRTGKYNYRVIEMTDQAVELEFYENNKAVGRSKFTMTDAAAAGLSGKDNWKKFPRNMLFARAISNGVKWYAPDIFNGATVYTPDELGASEDADGNIVTAPVATWYPETGEIVNGGTWEPVAPELRYQPEALRAKIQETTKRAADWKWTEPQEKLLCATLGIVFADDTDRHVVQHYLTGYQSLKDMDSGTKNALLKWLEPAKQADGKYMPNGMSAREANAVLTFVNMQNGQQELI